MQLQLKLTWCHTEENPNQQSHHRKNEAKSYYPYLWHCGHLTYCLQLEEGLYDKYEKNKDFNKMTYWQDKCWS